MSDKVSSKKVWLLKTLDIVVTILPLIILVLIRHDKYIYSRGSAVGFSIGAVIAVAVIVLTVLDKLHLKALGASAVGIVLCYFLRNVLNDVEWILVCVFIGQLGSRIVNAFLSAERERVTIEKNARATSKQMKSVMQNIIFNGNGRV